MLQFPDDLKLQELLVKALQQADDRVEVGTIEVAEYGRFTPDTFIGIVKFTSPHDPNPDQTYIIPAFAAASCFTEEMTKGDRYQVAVCRTTNPILETPASKRKKKAITPITYDRLALIVGPGWIGALKNFTEASSLLFGRFLPALAHEIGHVISGHLDPDPAPRKTNTALVSPNKTKPGLTVEECVAILKGEAMGAQEFEADLAAMHYVHRDNLLAMRLELVISHPNLAAQLEGINRLNELYKESATMAQPPKYYLAFSAGNPAMDLPEFTMSTM